MIRSTSLAEPVFDPAESRLKKSRGLEINDHCGTVVALFRIRWRKTILAQEALLAKKPASHRVEYTKDHIRQLKALIKAKTPMAEIAKAMERTAAAVRMKAHKLGIIPKRAKKSSGRRGRRASR